MNTNVMPTVPVLGPLSARPTPEQVSARAQALIGTQWPYRYARTLGVLEALVEGLARDHEACTASNCGLCNKLRDGLTAIHALNHLHDLERKAARQ